MNEDDRRIGQRRDQGRLRKPAVKCGSRHTGQL
jgi:hypothetical protein